MYKRQGIQVDGVSSTDAANWDNRFEMPENVTRGIQASVDDIYDKFVNKVSANRNMPYEEVHAIAKGRIWSGKKALQLGLIDKIGELDDAIESASAMAEIDNYKVVRYFKELDPFEIFISELLDNLDIEFNFGTKSKKILNSENCKKIIFPDDVVCAEDGVLENPQTKDISMVKSSDKILDVGVDSISKYTKILRVCQTIFWNGPLGYVEKAPYDKGTTEIAKIIANADCFSAIGGGDTVPVIEKLGLNDQFSFLSTGGGALMKFFEGSNMPILTKLGLDNK